LLSLLPFKQKVNFYFLPMRLLVFIGILLALGCRNDRGQYLDVDFSEDIIKTQDSSKYLSNTTLKVAVSTMTSPKETFIQYQALLNYLGDELNRQIEFKQRKTYQEVNGLLAEGKLDLAFVCSGAYVVAKDKIPLEILAVPVINGSVYYRGYLIVNKSTPYQSFNDLKGKRFAFSDPLSNSGYFTVLDLLDSMNETTESYFSNIIFTYGHDNSIRAIAKNLVDGASVEGLIFEYFKKFRPQEVKNIRIIKKSKLYGIPPVVVPENLEDETKRQLRDILLKMHSNPRGKEILKKLLIDRFELGEEKNYNMVRNKL
jgi:phosphate/phosphite/phosphonate ABC transporter binding protein